MWDLDYEERKWSHSVVSDSCDPMDCSLPGSSVHGIFQARILDWVAISFSRRSSSQGLNPGFRHCRQTLYPLSHQGSLMKKAEHQRIDAFKLWYRRRLFRVPWEIKPVNPKRNQPWIFIGRTDAEAKTPILWPSDLKNWLLGKDLDAGNDWKQEEKGTTEDEMVGWHHQLNGHEFE